MSSEGSKNSLGVVGLREALEAIADCPDPQWAAKRARSALVGEGQVGGVEASGPTIYEMCDELGISRDEARGMLDVEIREKWRNRYEGVFHRKGENLHPVGEVADTPSGKCPACGGDRGDRRFAPWDGTACQDRFHVSADTPSEHGGVETGGHRSALADLIEKVAPIAGRLKLMDYAEAMTAGWDLAQAVKDARRTYAAEAKPKAPPAPSVSPSGDVPDSVKRHIYTPDREAGLHSGGCQDNDERERLYGRAMRCLDTLLDAAQAENDGDEERRRTHWLDAVWEAATLYPRMVALSVKPSNTPESDEKGTG